MKERLTGAVILVALVVLLVPELLTGPIRPKSAPASSSRSAYSTASAPEIGAARMAHAEPPLRSYTLTLGGASFAHGAVAPPATQAPTPSPRAAVSQADAPGSSRSGTGTVSDLQVAKPAAHRVVSEARSAASNGGWVVQLGSFASRQNADHLARSLGGRGFRMTVSPARAGTRVLWRVRAGPAHDRAAAQHLAARLQALGHRGELLPVR